jgi:beta-glucuronidase
MSRRFAEHTRRLTQDLSGTWDFAFLGDVDPEQVRVEDVAFDDRMVVPGCFDATPRYAGRRGVAAYRVRVSLGGKRRARLVVDGAHHHATFLLDGVRFARHAGGFTRFRVELPAAGPGEHELVILVDNRFDELRSPLHLEYFDWYHHGGLTRGLALEEVPDVVIEAFEVRTSSWERGEIELALHVTAARPEQVPCEVRFRGRALLSERLALPAGETRVVRSLTLPQAAPWSPATPTLHELHALVGDDDAVARFGLREIAVRGRELLLNGEPLVLRGVNRHEAHPTFGHAVPAAVQLADLQLVQAMGGNFVRGSHYPQDGGFLDLCDELGVLVMSEAIGWQQTEAHLTSEAYLSAQETHIDEMIAAGVNHPCVILWGLLNESCSTTERGRSGYTRLIERIRRRDASRPVTYASNQPHSDVCFDLADLVCVNTYPGWYFGDLESVAGYLDELVTLLAERAPGKPILVGEIGAGAVYGFHDHNGQRWTEEFQEALLDRALDRLIADRRVLGVAIWQLTDCRTSERIQNALGRPRGYNNKGLFDEYRRPKLAVRAVRKHFAAR